MVEVKVKAAPVNAMKAYGSSSGIIRLILNLGTGWTKVVSFALRPLHPSTLEQSLSSGLFA